MFEAPERPSRWEGPSGDSVGSAKVTGRRRSRLRWIIEGVAEWVTVLGRWRKLEGGGSAGALETAGAAGSVIAGSQLSWESKEMR